MVITTIGSHVTTADEVIVHWQDVNTDRLANALPELALPGPYLLANFTADRDALDASLTALVGLANAREQAIDDRNAHKENMRERVRQFGLAVRLYLKGTTYAKRLPPMPQMSVNETKFLRPLDDMAEMWTRIDADTSVPGFTPPLLLTGGYTQAGFATDVATMRTLYRDVTEAENNEDIARKERDTMLGPLRTRMLQYRNAILLEYGPDHPFTQSLPEVYGDSSGTPDAVVLSGQWDASSMSASFSWNDSSEPDLDRYELRMTPGPVYDTANDTVVGTFSPGTTATETVAGLAAPGDVASFKLYVVLSSGNEAGSNTITITRP